MYNFNQGIKTSEYHSIQVRGINDKVKWFATRKFHNDVIKQMKATVKSYKDRGLTPPCTPTGV